MRRKKDARYYQKGFTLIEILIMVVIIGFLTATISPELFNRVSQAKQTTTRNQLDILKLALDNYWLDNGHYPTTEQGLQALVEEPTIPPLPINWRGPYLEKKTVPVDSWGTQYQYLNPGVQNTHRYDLWSWGADYKEGGSGENSDITNW